MKLDKNQIKGYSMLYNVSEEFVEALCEITNNLSDITEKLDEFMFFLKKQKISKELAERIFYTTSLIKKDNPNADLKEILTLPQHSCPLEEEDKDCIHCPLHPTNLVPYSIFLVNDFQEKYNIKANVQMMMESLVEELSNDEEKLLDYIRNAQQKDASKFN